MNEIRYAHVVAYIREHAWAILPSTLQVMTDLIRFRSEGGRLTDDEINARLDAASAGPRGGQTRSGMVAVLPLYGVISRRASLMSEMSGGASLERFAAQFRDAVNSPDVSAIVLDIDSPGGTTDGLTELAAEIRAAGKPTVAVANTMMCSAAYWLGSACDEIIAAPSASYVGNIGVYGAHQDVSKMAENLGVKTTLISAGKYKVEGNPYEPLSDEARAAMQQTIDDAYALFVNDVAKGRRATANDVRNGYGEGRPLPAKRALAANLVDRIGTLDDAIARAASGKVAKGGMKAMSDGGRVFAGQPAAVGGAGPEKIIAAVPDCGMADCPDDCDPQECCNADECSGESCDGDCCGNEAKVPSASLDFLRARARAHSH